MNTRTSFDVLWGMRNPSKLEEISWLLRDSFETRSEAVRVGRKLHMEGCELVRVVRMTAQLEWQPITELATT